MKTGEMGQMGKVDRYTRAGKMGKNIWCGECDRPGLVYHFSWSALGCCHCKALVKKENWGVVKYVKVY
jgi:hypothetical protein